MYKDSYNDYIRNVLGDSNTNNENTNLKYPEEDKSYYCDYSHPKNNMQQFDNQNTQQYNIPNNAYNEQNYNMQDYNIMYSDYQNRYGMPNYYDYGDYPNGYNYTETRAYPEIEECYPEIYGIVYPMVQKACRNVTDPVTKADVEKMVEELYGSLEGNDDINVNITLNNNIDKLNSIQVEGSQGNSIQQTRIEENLSEAKQEINYRQRPTKQPNRSTGLFKPNVEPTRDIPIPPRVEKKQEVRNNLNTNILEKTKDEPKETRYCNNGLCDIIRILLVRELLGGPNKPSPRPPYRPGPRPPFGPFPPYGPGFGPRPFYR